MLLGIRRAVSRTRPSQRLARPIPPLANLESTFSFIHPTVIDRPCKVHRYSPRTLAMLLLLLPMVMMVGGILPRAPSKLTPNEFIWGHPCLLCCRFQRVWRKRLCIEIHCLGH